MPKIKVGDVVTFNPRRRSKVLYDPTFAYIVETAVINRVRYKGYQLKPVTKTKLNTPLTLRTEA